MTEEQPLHHNAVHIGRRVGVALVSGTLLLAVVSVARESRDPRHWLGALLPTTVVAASWPTVWRSRRIYASKEGLRVEIGAASRFVPWGAVTGIARPFWVINPLSWFEARTITLHDGTRVLFFPAPGAVALVHARMRPDSEEKRREGRGVI